MSTFEYEVVQPPNAGELDARLREKSQLGVAVLEIVAVRMLDELAIRRGADNPKTTYAMTIDYSQRGSSPFILGHVNGDTEVQARLEVVNQENITDDARRLHLTIFDPNV